MGNPRIDQGTINRLITSLVVPAFSNLNVTSPYLGKNGIKIAFDGESNKFIPTLTGNANSPEPYQMARITINLLKTQSLAATYKARQELNSIIGDIQLRGDSSVLPLYNIINCSIQNVPDLNFAGEDADYNVVITGTRYLNSSLFNA